MDLSHQRYREYPHAIWVGDKRLPLSRETRFTRIYTSPDGKVFSEISRFMDGTAAITAEEVKTEWPTWSKADRRDFCYAFYWLRDQSDYSEIIKVFINDGDFDVITATASEIASFLKEEAFPILLPYLEKSEPGKGANLTQGIIASKHPDAVAVVRKRLALLRSHNSLWISEGKLNHLTHEFVCGIKHLLEVGAANAEFAEDYQKLLEHPNETIRTCTVNFLSKYFPEQNK